MLLAGGWASLVLEAALLSNNIFVEGYRVPLNTAILDPMLILGVPRGALILISVLAGIIFQLQQFYMLFIPLIAFIAMKQITKQDPYGFEIFKEALVQPTRLET